MLVVKITYSINIPWTSLLVCIQPTNSCLRLPAFLKPLSMAGLGYHAPRTSRKWRRSHPRKQYICPRNWEFYLKNCGDATKKVGVSLEKVMLFKEFYPRHLDSWFPKFGLFTRTWDFHPRNWWYYTDEHCKECLINVPKNMKKKACEHLPVLITMPEIRNCDNQSPQRFVYPHETPTCK